LILGQAISLADFGRHFATALLPDFNPTVFTAMT
jgi:hypothetical protein